MKKKNKNLSYEALKSSIIDTDKPALKHIDKLLKLAKYHQDIETISLLAIKFKSKPAAKYLQTIQKKNVEDLFITLNIDLIDHALNNGMDIKVRNPKSYTLLHKAAELDKLEVLEYLLSKNVNLDSQLNNGATPLLLAAEKNNYRTIKTLISSGANIDLSSKLKYTPLLAALTDGNNLEAVNYLIDHGANVNAQGVDGHTPLIVSAYKNYYAITELLIKNHANPNLVELNGYTALHGACLNDNENIVELLLQTDVNINHQDKDGNTPLIIAARKGLKNIVQQLLNMDLIDLNKQNNQGDSALILAAYFNHLGVVKLLVQAGAELHLKSKEGGCAIDFSIKKVNKDVTDYLMEVNAKSAQSTQDLNKQLIHACEIGHIEFAKLFIRSGADINARGKNGFTPLITACLKNHIDIVKLLIGSGANLETRSDDAHTALSFSANHGFENIVELLLKAGADPNAQDLEGNCPLHWVVLSRTDGNFSNPIMASNIEPNNASIRIGQLLLQNGCNPNLTNNLGTLPLYMASGVGDIEMVKLLLDNNANADVEDSSDFFPLLEAAIKNHLEVCKLLINRGADVNRTASLQEATPLFAAIKHKNFEIVKLLIEAGADLNHVGYMSSSIDSHFIQFNDIIQGDAKGIAESFGHSEIKDYIVQALESRESLVSKEIEENKKSIANIPEINSGFTYEEIEYIFNQLDTEEVKYKELKKKLDDKDNKIEKLNHKIKILEDNQAKVAQLFETRCKLLYKSLVITDKALKSISRLNENTRMILESKFSTLDKGEAKFRDKIYGTDIIELDFNKTGRFYINKIATSYEIICVGDKNTQVNDIKYIQDKYPSRKV